MLLRTLAPCVLLAIVAQQVSASRAQRSGPTSGGRGKFSDPTHGMQCVWRAREVGSSAVRLTVTCENPEARVTGGVTDLQCDYNGRPQSCEGFRSDPRGFWRQVGRAFKRLQGKVCRDERALVKAGVCKAAPRDAHFKMDISSAVASAQSGGDDRPATTRSTTARSTRSTTTRSTTTTSPAGPTTCTVNRQKAEDYCSSSWVSVCNFFLSMVQSDDC